MTEEIREQALYFPTPLLQTLQQEAARLDGSLSLCLRRAWTLARDRVRQLGPEAVEDGTGGDPFDKRKHTILFPAAMLREIVEEANRLDTSLSFVVCRAWRIAEPEIRALTPARP